MILTITPSPAIDWTIQLNGLSLGELNRGTNKSREASGKGVNVAMALHNSGVQATAMLPIGGENGKFMLDSLAERGLPVRSVETLSDIRTNITLSIEGQPETKINTESDFVSENDMEKLLNLLSQTVTDVNLIVTCGSLPAAVAPDFHKQVIEIAHSANKLCFLDTSGESLDAAIVAGPDLIKPNVSELAELTGRRIEKLGDVESASQSLIDQGVGIVLASLGPDGAMIVDSEQSVWGKVDGVNVKNSVGAGDALLAGFISNHQNQNQQPNLTNALVWASSAVQSETTFFEIDDSYYEKASVMADFDREANLSSIAEPGKART